MAAAMSEGERRAFLSAGTRTGMCATTRKDGTPHVAPVWFVPDGDDLIFMTGAGTVKGASLRRTGVACMSVDDPHPPFSFVTVTGRVTISEDLDEMLGWSIAIGRRYMGDEQGEEFGRRNAVEGELLVRLTPEQTVAVQNLTE